MNQSMNIPMNAAGIPPVLFAQAENWREMGRDFRVDHAKLDPTLIIVSVIVLVAVVTFLIALHRLMNRQEGSRQYNSPKQLFRSLCKLHELTSAERRLLSQVARTHQLAPPGLMFLAPEKLDATIAAASTAQRKPLEALRAKLFSDLDRQSAAI